jgi:hypothetical protein
MSNLVSDNGSEPFLPLVLTADNLARHAEEKIPPCSAHDHAWIYWHPMPAHGHGLIPDDEEKDDSLPSLCPTCSVCSADAADPTLISDDESASSIESALSQSHHIRHHRRRPVVGPTPVNIISGPTGHCHEDIDAAFRPARPRYKTGSRLYQALAHTHIHTCVHNQQGSISHCHSFHTSPNHTTAVSEVAAPPAHHGPRFPHPVPPTEVHQIAS